MMKSVRLAVAVAAAYLALVPSGRAGNGLNDLLGIQLWGSRSLWEDVASDTATRLRLSDQASQNQNGSYFRANLDKAAGLKVLGARVYSIEIYSSNRKVTRVVIGFVNRADLIEELGAEVDEKKANPSAAQFLTSFEMRLAREREAAYAGMTSQLGKRLGRPAEGTASTVRQWNWEKHLLTLENAELALTLRIEPQEKISTAAPATTTQLKAQKLRSRSNGDVVVTGIPAISQGPRGFCVPASWEKCLRYHGLNLDVYELGEKGGTDFNGTPFIPFAAKMAPMLEARHFKMQLLKPDALGLAMVKAYIDQASPLIWCMDARELRYWVERSRKRSSYLNDEAEGVFKDPYAAVRQPAPHAILIVGYNATLKEFALSDSTELGSGEGEIWIKEKELLSYSLPEGLVAVLPEDSGLAGETKFLNPALVKKSAPSSAAPSGKKWY